ncbi:MAG: FecR domain-containing protein [Bryobacterales bacterium]|nr:FecR domain-containing protein [Bryobacterales bacterium]
MTIRLTLALLGAVLPLAAQNVISARSGLIHHVEGDVRLDGERVEVSAASFPSVKQRMELRTGEGRAEVLLNPGVFLRLGENSAFLMIDDRLTNAVVEILEGTAVFEVNNELKGGENAVTIIHRETSIDLRKGGLYRVSADPAVLRVFEGEAQVQAGDQYLAVKKGRQLPLSGVMVAEKFETKETDALDRWSRRRSEYFAMANISGARSVRDSGMNWARSGWFFNPYFGMFTFIPQNGVFFNPYGFAFYSPRTVYRVFAAPVMLSAQPGFNSGMGRPVALAPGGRSGVISRAPASVSAPTTGASGASSAPISRQGAGGGRGR